MKREDLFLQTKFTPFRGQDPNNIPYDKNLPLRDQVVTSFQVSLANLHTEYLDGLLLHSPMSNIKDTMSIWRTFEEIQRGGTRPLFYMH